MNRVKYFDSLRLLAIFVVYLTHFIDSFHPEYFSFWTTLPSSLLLEGVSGKLGVALFGVLLGYFAYLSKEENAVSYILKRYTFFAVSALVINSLYFLKGFLCGGEISPVRVLIESLTLDDDIFSTYWCIPIFFAASIVSYLNGRANVPTIGILFEIVIFYKLQNIWLAVCLMGNLVARYKTCPGIDVLRSRLVRIALWIVLFFAIKRPECNVTYMIHGMCCTVMIILIIRGEIIKRILDNNLLAAMGRQGMAIYILHPICYSTMAPILFRYLERLPYGWSFAITLAVCFGIIVLISFPVMTLINRATRYICSIITKIMSSNWWNKILA